MTVEAWMIENEMYSRGCQILCGVDEAGRGPLAGPVCAAAVILPKNIIIPGLDDSKKLSPKKREALYDTIRDVSLSTGAAFSTVDEIEELGIVNATFLAMNRAVARLELTPDMLLIDGNQFIGINVPAQCIVKGDEKCVSIAAASIIAKVTRDRYMLKMARVFPQYGFERHKGYGTKLHYEKIREHGACPIHRRSFLKKLH